MDNSIQQLLDSTAGRFVELPPGEYQGPFVVRRPLNIMGNATTLWAKGGPVLTVSAREVAMRDLRIEVTGTESENAVCVVSTTGDTRFENVEISGCVQGVPGEEGLFDVPSALELGEFYGGRECSFQVEIASPVRLRIQSLIKDVTVTPEEAGPGKTVLTIQTRKIRPGTYLYGDLLLKSSFTRRVYISGAAKEDPKGYQEGRLLRSASVGSPSAKGAGVAGTISYGPATPVAISPETVLLAKGQRLPWNQPIAEPIVLELHYENKPVGMDIDPYVFLLDQDKKAVEDWRLVFFGNPISKDGSVAIADGSLTSSVSIKLSVASMDVERISIAYAIYEDSPGGIFSYVKNPVVKVLCGGKEVFAYQAEGLSEETTIIGLEFYRYKGAWKLTAIGAGYKDGIRRLCESYGLDIIG